MRLRPSGTSGILVSHIEGFREYQLKQAWTWEHQALVRARAIGGDPVLVQHFEEIRKEILILPREGDILKKAIREMRERMRKEHVKPEIGMFDLKEGRGGMVDVEFLVQYLVLLCANRYPQIVEWTDNVRLLQSLMESGVIDEQTAYFLRRAFLTYRATLHRLNLQEKPDRVPSDRFVALRKGVRRIWTELLEE
jgi:glutamate-ammonia-ligase adenylyltransferase